MSQTAAEKAALIQLIADCKSALRRHDDSSDSDETEIAYGTNRGNKLKRKARQVHAGSLDAPTGKKLMPEVIDYNGRQRTILYRNKVKKDEQEEKPSGPGRKRKQKKASVVDEDSLSDEDPFADVQIENILAPAVEPRDIPTHPALSIPYTSRPLTELCEQAQDIICAEHKHIVMIKSLLTHFLGDDPFVTTDKMESVIVPRYIQEAQRMIEEQERSRMVMNEARRTKDGETQSTVADNDIEMVDGDMVDEKGKKSATELPAKSPVPKVEHPSPPDGFPETAGESSGQPAGNSVVATSQEATAALPDPDATQSTLPPGVDPHEIVNSTSSWFYPPERDEEARNFGIPAYEAEETRQLLLLAVQKEEEFIRGLERVRDMLLKADRRRKEVWEWCRADGAPEMSDNEDYVDLERWGLKEGDLIKGVEEEEEEEAKGKKTVRNSRRG